MDNGVFGGNSSAGLDGDKDDAVEYRQSVKVDTDGGSGLTVDQYDYQTDDVQSLSASIVGTEGQLAFAVHDDGSGDLGKIYDMSDWVFRVLGLPSGQIARIVDGGGTEVASVVGGGSGTDDIDLYSTRAIIEDCVALRIRNVADSATLITLTPTDDGTHGEPGLFGGDVITYTP